MSQYNLTLLERLRAEAEAAEKATQEGGRPTSLNPLSELHIAELPEPLTFQYGSTKEALTTIAIPGASNKHRPKR